MVRLKYLCIKVGTATRKLAYTVAIHSDGQIEFGENGAGGAVAENFASDAPRRLCHQLLTFDRHSHMQPLVDQTRGRDEHLFRRRKAAC